MQNLEEIKALGKLLYSEDQVRRALGLSEDEFEQLTTENTPMSDAYWAGFYETDIKHRKGLIDLGEKGSSPAQAAVRKLLNDREAARFYE